MDEQMMEPNRPQKRENVVAGIVGAFLGSLLGVLCIVVVGQMGYVASISGLVMAVCSLKGYELLGGRLSKKGCVISGVLILGMTYLAHQLDWAVTAASSLDMNIFDAFRAIPRFLSSGMIEASSFWSGLVMLYMFTLLGAVPTIVSGLKPHAAPNIPIQMDPSVLENQTELEAEFYPAERRWISPLRASSLIAMLPGLFLGIIMLLVAVAIEVMPLVFAALGCLIASFICMVIVMPLTQLCQVDSWMLLRLQGVVWRVNVPQLNMIDTYRFTNKAGIRALSWERLSPEEQERAKNSVLRAISLLCSGQLMPGSTLSQAVMPLTDLRVLKETKWGWRVAYSVSGNKWKKVWIGKAYPNFAPTEDMPPCVERTPWNIPVIIVSLVLVVAFSLGGAVWGTMMYTEPGGNQGGTSKNDESLTARVPAQVTEYEVDGVSFPMDSAYVMDGEGIFYDPATDTDYYLSAWSNVSEQSALEYLLDPISMFRDDPEYDRFRFEYVTGENTLVPLTAADGSVYQHNILTVYFTDGTALHTAVALTKDGILLVAEGFQSETADEHTVKGDLLYMLENAKLGEHPGTAVITEENYRSLFHLASEEGYQYIGVGYIKAPKGMFEQGGFLDAYLPYQEGEPDYPEEDASVISTTAHGMEVTVTMVQSSFNAQDAVEEAYESFCALTEDSIDTEEYETIYSSEYDIALKEFYHYDNLSPRYSILYADTRGNGWYLLAKITYLLDEQDADYPALLEELRDVYGINLPDMEAVPPAVSSSTTA